jgi:hypothetical protein
VVAREILQQVRLVRELQAKEITVATGLPAQVAAVAVRTLSVPMLPQGRQVATVAQVQAQVLTTLLLHDRAVGVAVLALVRLARVVLVVVETAQTTTRLAVRGQATQVVVAGAVDLQVRVTAAQAALAVLVLLS